MSFLNEVKHKASEFAQENSAALLTAGGVVGVVATGIFSGRAGYKYAKLETTKQVDEMFDLIESDDELDIGEFDKLDSVIIPKKDLIVGSAMDLLPPVLTGAAAITAIIMSNRMSAQKAAALAAAYGIADRNLADYKAKVAEKLTGPKAQQIDEELAQERVNSTPGHEKIVIVEGEVLCFDEPSGRYFNSTMERIRQAVNTTNAEVHNHGYARLGFFYQELGLPDNTWSDEVGFTTENLLELDFKTILAPDNRPCIAFTFKRLPTADFHPKY